jgi:hypothetical protein
MDRTSTHWSLWFAFLGGPLAWTAHELLSYLLVRPVCTNGVLILEYVVTLATLATAAAAGYMAVRILQSAPESRNTPRFLSMAAILLNVLFAYAIVMETLPNVVVGPCL